MTIKTSKLKSKKKLPKGVTPEDVARLEELHEIQTLRTFLHRMRG